MAPKLIQTVLRFPKQSARVAEDAPLPILPMPPNSQPAKKSEGDKDVVRKESLLIGLISLLDRGYEFEEVGPLIRDTVQQITKHTGRKPKRPRESEASKPRPAPNTRKTHTFFQKAYHLRQAKAAADAAAYCRKHNIPESSLSEWQKNAKHIHRMILCGNGGATRYRRPAKYAALYDELFARYVGLRDLLIGVTYRVLTSWADSLSRDFSTTSPRAKRATIKRFCKTHGLVLRTVTKVAQMLPADAARRVLDFRSRLGLITKDLRAQGIQVTRIFFGDETFVLYENAKKQTLVERGTKHVGVRMFNEKAGCTAFLSATASWCKKYGTFSVSLHPPDLIFQTKAKNSTGSCVINELSECARTRAAIGKSTFRVFGSPNGWTTKETFTAMMAPHLPRLPLNERGLIVVDMYAAHRTPDFEAFAKKRGWIIVFIPGGCTSEVQVHDLAVNKKLKDILRDKHEKLCTTRGEAMKPSREQICSWVADAYEEMTEAVTTCAMAQLIGPVMNREVTQPDANDTLDSLADATETVEDLTKDFADIAIENDDGDDVVEDDDDDVSDPLLDSDSDSDVDIVVD